MSHTSYALRILHSGVYVYTPIIFVRLEYIVKHVWTHTKTMIGAYITWCVYMKGDER